MKPSWVRRLFWGNVIASVALGASWWVLRVSDAPAGATPKASVNVNATPPASSAAAPVTADELSAAPEKESAESDLRRYASQSRRQDRASRVLEVVARLKQGHALTPPPVPLPPPPTAAFGSTLFPELLNDPEYRDEYRRMTRELWRVSYLPVLGRLGISTEQRDAAAALIADKQLVQLEPVLQSGRVDEVREAREAQLQRIKAYEDKLREVLGEDAFARFRPASNSEAAVLAPLNLRLSYSAEPLSPAQVASIRGLLLQRVDEVIAEKKARLAASAPDGISQKLPDNETWRGSTSVPIDDRLVQVAATTLSPAQVAALREIQAEQDATAARRKLPRDSALPKLPGT